MRLDGRFTGQELLVLAGRKGLGAGYRVIEAFETAEGRRILVDRGFLAEDDRRNPRPARRLTIAGNLHWPEDTDSYTPPPDLKAGLWFARDVPAMAGTGHRADADRRPRGRRRRQGVEVLPVDTSGIPNDHLGYAITWFSLAVVWAGMTAFLLWRIRARTIGRPDYQLRQDRCAISRPAGRRPSDLRRGDDDRAGARRRALCAQDRAADDAPPRSRRWPA